MAELQERVEALEALLARKALALQEASDEFQAAIYTITHDFKAPLRSILASCMILREDYGSVIGGEGSAELERQKANVKKLESLLEDLLKVSRLARIEPKPGRLSLKEVAVASAEEIGPAALEALSIEDAEISGDAQLLQVALRELISNSVKFASSDRSLEIRVRAEGSRVLVKDNGVGFDPARAEKIFLPFERLHGPDYPGSGVGLTLAKRAIDRNGGKIGCDSVPGKGSTFWFIPVEG